MAVAGLVAGCRPSDVLSVPPPAGVETSGSLASQSGAEGALAGAKAQLFSATDGSNGIMGLSELLTDEFTFSAFSQDASEANIDARIVSAGANFSDVTIGPWGGLLQARSSLILTVPLLVKYEPASGRSKVGESYALMAYAELLLAETYCDGTPLDAGVPGGGIQYGTPLTDDSLLGVAVAHFDSALAAANGDPTVVGLARVGLGRALVDREQFAAADTAVASVLTSFVYNADLAPDYFAPVANPLTVYAATLPSNFGCALFNVSDREGTSGLDFASAADPRLQFDSTLAQTCDGGAFAFPTKFAANLAAVPLATGVEARLIQAEAALQRNDPNTWATDLSDLRADVADTHVAFDTSEVPIKPDSTTGAPAPAQVDFMFRERAFWLFGTGARLGDMRRLIRQYGRDQSTVYPTGPYPDGNDPNLPSPLPRYGADVDFGLATPQALIAERGQITNPNYRGCTSPTTAA